MSTEMLGRPEGHGDDAFTFEMRRGSCGYGGAQLPPCLGNLYSLHTLHGEQPHCWDTRTSVGNLLGRATNLRSLRLCYCKLASCSARYTMWMW
jgi:hypothetical protein